MDEKKTVFNFLSEVMVIFGFSLFVLNIFCLIFGNSAKDISTMFELGNQGVPVKIAFQFFIIAILTAGGRMLFFTDIIIKRMAIWVRTVCMLTIIIVIIIFFIITFHWFPVNMWQPWLMFFICFGVSFLCSYFMMVLKEKVENKQLEEALYRLKEKEDIKNDICNYNR